MPRASVAVRFALASLALAGSVVTAAAAEVQVAGWGTLLLAAPYGWRQEIQQHQLMLTVTFMPANSTPFQMMVVPLRSPQGTMPPATQDDLRRSVSAEAEQARSQVVESSIPIRDFPSDKVFGSYHSATYRAPEPGEYKHMTRGRLAIEGLPVEFTILSNGDPKVVVEPALRMLQSARKQ